MHLCEGVSACTAHVKNFNLKLYLVQILLCIKLCCPQLFHRNLTTLTSDYCRYTEENFKRMPLSVVNL